MWWPRNEPVLIYTEFVEVGHGTDHLQVLGVVCLLVNQKKMILDQQDV